MITRAGWLVTHIYEHYMFAQSKFKNDFVVMNQKSRQAATSSIEKDFYKFLNNNNFGIECRNNIENCYLEPIYDDFSEISYITRYANIYHNKPFRNFFSTAILKSESTETYTAKIFALDKEDPTYQSRRNYYERKMNEELRAVESFEKK